MSPSVPVLLSVELGASPATPPGVRLDRAEAAVVAEMYGWYADEAHCLVGLAKTTEQKAQPIATAGLECQQWVQPVWKRFDLLS